MALSERVLAELERLGVENVKLRLGYAGAGTGSVVPGILSPDPTRGDVENWLSKKLAEREARAAKAQADILWWAKAAAWIGICGILVAVLIAILGR